VLLAELATSHSVPATREDFVFTSYTSWELALRQVATGDLQQAEHLLREALHRYQRYLYIGDAAWLYTDLVIVALLRSDYDRADRWTRQQRAYIDDTPLRDDAIEEAEGSVELGDVYSGEYYTFIESTEVGSGLLTHSEREALDRYWRASRFLLTFYLEHDARDFLSAVDSFSFGWKEYLHRPYPSLFDQLYRAVGPSAQPGQYVNGFVTAHSIWTTAIETFVPDGYGNERTWELLREARERLRRAGFEADAVVVALDEMVLRIRDGDHQHVERRLRDVLPQAGEFVPEVGACVRALYASRWAPDELRLHVGRYVAERSRRRLVPDGTRLYVAYAEDVVARRHEPVGGPSDVEFLDSALYVRGALVYPDAPPLLRGLLSELWKAREESGDAYVPAGHLAERLDTTEGALAQVVRRFRSRLRERGLAEDRNALVESKNGYRLNQDNVRRLTVRSLDAPGSVVSEGGLLHKNGGHSDHE
jgi:hypothetical protein